MADAAREPTQPFGQSIAGSALRVELPAPRITHSRGRDDWAWIMEIYSLRPKVLGSQLHEHRLKRARGNLEAQLHDLLAASLVPLTQQHTAYDMDGIEKQAKLFFASFDISASWVVDVQNLQPAVGRVIHGSTENSRKSDLGNRFLRLRFPYISFEWFVQTPYFEVASCSAENAVDVEILWKAWSRQGAASGLVAYGSIKDKVKRQRNKDPEGNVKESLVIMNRNFSVTRVFQPELMTPVPYPRIIPPYLGRNDLMLFSTSWTVIQFLRSSHVRLGFLVALSALFASLQPIVGNFSVTGGWILTACGVLSALASILAMLLGWSLEWSESQAAKQRQDVDK